MRRLENDYKYKPILWKPFIGCVSDDGSEFYMLLHYTTMDSAIKFMLDNIIQHDGMYHFFEYKGMGCQDAFIDDITSLSDACICTYRTSLLHFDKSIDCYTIPKKYVSYYDGKRVITTDIHLPGNFENIW